MRERLVEAEFEWQVVNFIFVEIQFVAELSFQVIYIAKNLWEGGLHHIELLVEQMYLHYLVIKLLVYATYLLIPFVILGLYVIFYLF